MWPFSCGRCSHLEKLYFKESEESKKWNNTACELLQDMNRILSTTKLKFVLLEKEVPPIKTNLLVANKDFSYFGFLYLEDGWDYSRKINMQGKDGVIWATYTNAESIAWWLNLDLIKKDVSEHREPTHTR